MAGAELCSLGSTSGGVLLRQHPHHHPHPRCCQHAPSASPKEFQVSMSFQEKIQEMSKSALALPTGDQMKSVQQHQALSLASKPDLLDVQASRLNAVFFSFAIAEQCTRHEKILKFLKSGSNSNGDMDMSLFAELTAPLRQPYVPYDQLCASDAGVDDPNHLLHQEKQFFIPEPLLDFIESLQINSTSLSIDQAGRVLVTGGDEEVKDLLSIVAEFDPSKNLANDGRAALLVPFFDRKSFGRGRANKGMLSEKQPTETLTAPAKGSDAIYSKVKKKHKPIAAERDLYHKNSFHALEAFFSLLLDRNKGSIKILAIKKSGPEICHLLSQISTGIAGTGLAVILSIVCKVAVGRASLTSSRLLNTTLGLGLFWLSVAVNALRDSVGSVFRSSGKAPVTEEVMAMQIERSMNQVLVRAAVLAALAVLRVV